MPAEFSNIWWWCVGIALLAIYVYGLIPSGSSSYGDREPSTDDVTESANTGESMDLFMARMRAQEFSQNDEHRQPVENLSYEDDDRF